MSRIGAGSVIGSGNVIKGSTGVSVVGDNNVLDGCDFGEGPEAAPRPRKKKKMAPLSAHFSGEEVVLAGAQNGARVVSLVVELADGTQLGIPFAEAEAELGRPVNFTVTARSFARVEVSTTTGSLEFHGPVEVASVSSVTGPIKITGNAQQAHTTRGDITIGGDCENAQTTAGSITFVRPAPRAPDA